MASQKHINLVLEYFVEAKPEQVKKWVDRNVTDLTEAKKSIAHMLIIFAMILKKDKGE